METNNRTTLNRRPYYGAERRHDRYKNDIGSWITKKRIAITQLPSCLEKEQYPFRNTDSKQQTLPVDLPIALENTLAFSEVVGAITGTVIGIQTLFIQQYLDDNYRGEQSVIAIIALSAFTWAIIFGVVIS